eukprot:scaffold8376_cov33-Tisochrysis_lutea.AAC.2
MYSLASVRLAIVLCMHDVSTATTRLVRLGVTAYMKDMVTLLLENRPDEPIGFITDYFRTVLAGSNQLTRALRFIKLSPAGHSAFEDNLVAAYASLDGRRGHVAAGELQKLLRLLCADAPLNVSRCMLILMDKRDADPISFAEFDCAVRATIHLNDTLCRAEALATVVSGAVPLGRTPLLTQSTSSMPGAIINEHVVDALDPDLEMEGNERTGEMSSGPFEARGESGYMTPAVVPRSLLDLILRQLDRARLPPQLGVLNDVEDHLDAQKRVLLQEVHSSLVAPFIEKKDTLVNGFSGMALQGQRVGNAVSRRDYFLSILRETLRGLRADGTENVLEASVNAATLRERAPDAVMPMAARTLISKMASIEVSRQASSPSLQRTSSMY